MKIEFKKIPQTQKEFTTEFNSVNLEGNFCRISPSLIKIEADLNGTVEVECCRCGTNFELEIDESLDCLLSDGIYNKESEDLVIEIQNGIIDFNEIIQNEIASLQSEYHFCEVCSNDDIAFEKEY